ncbi:MAG: hypothetical protein GF329_08780 [Candidatus Lokiarchaeota archaeon]|nr:hypothetical protein [Candidatus Lokiarchaeota archaeon]
MLNSVIILKNDSGVCLYSNNYELDFDSTLFSGFLTAVQNFAENLKIGRLTNFITNDKIIVLTSTENVVVSLIIDLKDNEEEWMGKAYTIAEKFEEKYDLENWTGDISLFRGFTEDLDEILESEEEILLMDVAKWARKEFGGELQVNAVLRPRKDIPKMKVDIVLDRGEIEPSKLHNKLSLKRFEGLKRDIIFIKLVDGIVGRGDIKDFIQDIQEFGLENIDEAGEEIFPYFPKMAVIIGRDYSSTVKDLEDELYSKKNDKHFIQSKYLKLNMFPAPLRKFEVFNCFIEYWSWKKPYPKRIFK